MGHNYCDYWEGILPLNQCNLGITAKPKTVEAFQVNFDKK